MVKSNIEIVEELPGGKLIIKIEKEVAIGKDQKKVVKYTFSDGNDIVNILDSKGELSDIQFFDNYVLNEFSDVIIGIKKDWDEYYGRILSHFDLSNTVVQAIEVPGGPFNIGPYSKQYYDYNYPTEMIEDIIPESYDFNYGLINRNGVLVIYPIYDQIQFSNENTCIVGLLNCSPRLKFGYNDLISGNAISPVCFDVAKEFSEQRAAIKYHNRYGYIDRQKVMTDPENPNEYAENLAPKFFRADEFKDGTANVIIARGNCFDSPRRAKIDLVGDIVEFPPHRRVLRKIKNNNPDNN